MSVRKSKSLTASPRGGTSFWVACAVCGRMIPRSISGTHLENSCKVSYPFIQNQTAHVTVTEVPSTSKVLELPFVGSRHSKSMIFISKEIITACGFVSFGWVMLRIDEEERGNVVPSDLVPLALRVWPIPDENSISRTYSGVFVTDSAINSSTILRREVPFTLENITSGSSPFNSFPPLQQAILQVACPDDADLVIPEGEGSQIIQNFKTAFTNRVVADGNVFRLPFYTLILELRVTIQPSTNNESIEESLKQLTLDNAKMQFYEITNNSEFSLQFAGPPAPKSHEARQVTLHDVGGLAAIVDEISSTIKYVFGNSKDSVRSSLSAGILLHGHHGTGKSLLTQAICISFKLNAIHYEEFSAKYKSDNDNDFSPISNLVELFSDAIRNSPCAVIIEDLDVIATRVSRSEANASFISQLRSQIERINSMHVEVIVLATCTDLEAVDTALRAPHVFGKEVEVPVPALNQREDILRKLIKSFKHNLSSEDIKQIASITHGFVGADLKSLLAQSHLHAVKRTTDTGNGISVRDIEECIKIVHPSAMKSILIDVPNVRWDDIGGQKDLKFKLKQAIEWPLKHPESFKRLGITPPKGILMYGPPGCSKTMIAKAIATESSLNFISVKGSELFSKWVGESEKAVRSLFRKARQVSPCIVFFDEIDSLGGERGSSSGGTSNVHERVLAQLLIEIDGIEALKDVTIVAATNRPDIIDPALLRPGRLDRIIHVPLPDEETRREIFNIHFRKMPITPDIDIHKLTRLTERYSGAELTAVCHEAALKALEENIECVIIQESHFVEALRLITPRTSQAQINFYENFSHSRSKNVTTLP